MLGNSKDVDDLDLDRVPSNRKPRIRGPNSKRLSGRPSYQTSVSSFNSLLDDGSEIPDGSEATSSQPDHHLFNSGLIGQVTTWIREEKAKRDARKTARKDGKVPVPTSEKHVTVRLAEALHGSRTHRSDDAVDDDVDLDRLEQILKESFPRSLTSRRGSASLRRRPSSRKLHKASLSSVAASSDTEQQDGLDMNVPSAEAWLDNTKTLGYTGGAAEADQDLSLTTTQTASQEAWSKFKFEIVRLTHTLRLKGWRRVPMEMSGEIDVSRLSGALTLSLIHI